MRRAVYVLFLLLASLRMRFADHLRWREWLRFVTQGLGRFEARAERSIWVHGEGMGEFNAAAKLIDRLRGLYPHRRFVFTSSRAVTCRWLAAKYPHDVTVPPPWDLPVAVRRYFQQLDPALILLLEFHDGFCPGALPAAREHRIPVVVVNARALHALKPLRFRVAEALDLVQEAVPYIDLFCAQDAHAAKALSRLGVAGDRVRMLGNMKYDQQAASPGLTRAALGIPKVVPVLVAGCVHADEEALVLRTFRSLRERQPTLFLVLAPYDLGRVAVIEQTLKARRLRYALRSAGQPPQVDVLVLDSLGELAAVYELADVVLLGGSFTPKQAGHSLVEPARHGKPIIFGPHMCSQQTMVATFLEHEAALQRPAKRLTESVLELLESASLRERLGGQARAVVESQAGATERTVAALGALSAARRQPRLPVPASTLAQSLKVATKVMATTRIGQAVLATRSRRIGSLSELHRRLGDPRTILCLGNGPSSEDDRLCGVDHDCLFRVNSRWLERGFLTRPDVVFTGDRESLRRCPPCLFGFRTAAEETSVLLNTFFDARRRRVEYFTWERLSDGLDESRWGARPTNGIVMLACAVALQPRRLIVAGIDLFQHPAGIYPGDRIQENRYAAMHDRDVELAILRQTLEAYRGELLVIGDVLKRALAA